MSILLKWSFFIGIVRKTPTWSEMSIKLWPRTYLRGGKRQSGPRDGGGIWVTLDIWTVLAFRFLASVLDPTLFSPYIPLLDGTFHSYDSNYHLYAIEFQICTCTLNLCPEFQTHISSHVHFHLEVIKVVLIEYVEDLTHIHVLSHSFSLARLKGFTIKNW